MNCQDVQGQLSDYLDLSLSAARRALIEGHLAACPPCSEEAELLGESIRQVAALPALDMPLGFVQRVMSCVREEETPQGFWQRFLLPLSGKLPIQATAVVVAGFLGVYLLQNEQPQQQISQTAQMMTAADNPTQDSAPPTAEKPSVPTTPAVPRLQSPRAQQTPQIASSRQHAPSNSRQEIS
jgi:anti-sigma factor RsiW